MFPMAFYRANLQEVVVVYHDTEIDPFYLFYKHFIFYHISQTSSSDSKELVQENCLIVAQWGIFLS